jgi:hypothetical protein
MEAHMLRILTDLKDHIRLPIHIDFEWGEDPGRESLSASGTPTAGGRSVSIIEAANLDNFRPEL